MIMIRNRILIRATLQCHHPRLLQPMVCHIPKLRVLDFFAGSANADHPVVVVVL